MTEKNPSENDFIVCLSKKERIASSGSKGNQRKWYKSGTWYKADFLGYEGLAEHMCTCLLKSSSIESYAEYRAIRIQESDGAKDEVLNGCMSTDFGNIVTGDTLIMQLPEKYNVWLNPSGSFEMDLLTFCEGVRLVFGVDITYKMKQMLSFDMIVGNEDRILRNFGLQRVGDKFMFAPLFDHGLSLLSDTTSLERVSSIADISFRPFGYCRNEGLEFLNEAPIKFDLKKLNDLLKNVPVYPHETINTAFSILFKSLEETEGKLWISL